MHPFFCQDVFMKAWNGPRCPDYSLNSTCVQDSLELTHGVSWNEVAKLWALAAPWSQAEHDSWINASSNAYVFLLLFPSPLVCVGY
jgi:hypothetical protein